jgi:hypothetical protein
MKLTIPLQIEVDDKNLENAIDKYMKENPDVVEVVRCKDCVWWEARMYGDTVGRCENPRNGLVSEYTDDGDFCSYGERRENGKS